MTQRGPDVSGIDVVQVRTQGGVGFRARGGSVGDGEKCGAHDVDHALPAGLFVDGYLDAVRLDRPTPFAQQ